MKLIKMSQWAEEKFSIPISSGTLSKWARLRLVHPAPQKIAGQWLVQPHATYVEKTIEAQRTEHAQKELKELTPTNVALSDKILRIVNNGTKAA
jgi:hypothetical protein